MNYAKTQRVDSGDSGGFRTSDIVYCAVAAVLISVCAWISIPAVVEFTMQTFGVFLTLLLLGGRRGTVAVALYILMGMIGLPVYAGFSGGIGVLLSTTGGYIVGFIFMGLIYWCLTSFLGDRAWTEILALVLGLIICYTFGTFWFITVYARNVGHVAIMTALGWCVFPFIPFDILKLVLAFLLSRRLCRYIK